MSDDHRSMQAWQLAQEMRREVLKLTARNRPSRDLRFRGQTEDAAGSVCRNIREGFYRFNPREFATFIRYSQASLGEVGEQLDEGIERGFWSEEDVTTARTLCKRAGSALGGLRRYLMSREARENADRIRARLEERTRKRASTKPHERREPNEP